MRFFVSGSGTGVGKTFFSALLAKHYYEQGADVSYIKPVQTGYPADNDALFIQEFSGIKKAKTIFTAEPPIAPCLCFEKFPIDEVISTINSDTSDVLIVEGAGGIAVPLDYETPTWKIAKECDLDIVVALPDRLGCVNEAILNYSFISNINARFGGFALNKFFCRTESDSQNAGIIEKILPASISYIYNQTLEII